MMPCHQAVSNPRHQPVINLSGFLSLLSPSHQPFYAHTWVIRYSYTYIESVCTRLVSLVTAAARLAYTAVLSDFSTLGIHTPAAQAGGHYKEHVDSSIICRSARPACTRVLTRGRPLIGVSPRLNLTAGMALEVRHER